MTPSIKSAAVYLCLGLFASRAARTAPESIAPNDNRIAAGTLSKGVLTLKLEARRGAWRPEGDQGRSIDVAAWAEEGKALTAPGPLIRVPVGTEIRATLRNSLDKPLVVFGFGKRRGMADSVTIPAHDSRDVRFTPTTPGTYYYAGRRGTQPFGFRFEQDMQLVGAIVVDPPGAPSKARDRVLLMSWWYTVDSLSPSGLGRATMAINGLSWPHTERIDLTQGDSVHWRVINMTEIDHPMHLHGFYFRMESKGDGIHDSLYTADQQRLAVTEVVDGFQTMSFSWVPSRPGNWIYHCHYAEHLSHNAELDTEKGTLDESMLQHHMSDRPHQMFGLVMGLRVAPKGPAAHSSEQPRAIRLLVREKANVYGKKPGYAFVLGGSAAEKDANAMPLPGPMLVLERNKPVAITVVNRSKDRASVHWHGVELESYPDGVPGWSGSGSEILPSIAPGDSLTVRFTPPRVGTFMYHSHFNESEQIAGGLYGPIIVVEPGQKFDPDHDRVLFFGTAGSTRNVIVGPFANHTLNGEQQPGPMELKAGAAYRFRLINLADGGPVTFSLSAGKQPVTWRAVAKDGAALPAVQATMRPAKLTFDPGEIYDFEFSPAKAGDLSLAFGPPPSGPPPPNTPPPPPTRTVAVHVR
ncbi:MAG: multicopper oxidase domain-containing protein [bacterium]